MAEKTSYDASTRQIAELFADYIEGDANRPALVLSARPLAVPARDALEKSIEFFGYAPPTCTFATTVPSDSSVEGGDIALDPQALYLMVEGLDPLYLIATDSTTVAALGEAYRIQLAPDAPARVFGRPAALLADFESSLKTERAKQAAWRVLKSLR